jgi:hypothetical protein
LRERLAASADSTENVRLYDQMVVCQLI